MNIRLVREPMDEKELRAIAGEFYVTMVKGTVDVSRGVVAVGGEYHIDSNNVLIADGSKQEDVWGFNFYFNRTGDERIEYISLVNIRPAHGNPGMEVSDASLREQMKEHILKYLSPHP